MTNSEKKIGNVFGATGGNYAGNVYDKSFLAPCLNAMTGGVRQPLIVEYMVVAERGRTGHAGGRFVQQPEVNKTGYANALTSVAKDGYVLEIRSETNLRVNK